MESATTAAARLQEALAGRYRIERELGAGGMATVYLAEDLRHSRKVAVKHLHPELSAVIGAERFLAEIRVTAALQHPHILPLFDSGQADSQLFYVMPYVAGESLRARLEREKQLPVDDAVRIAREVAGALDYAHRHGIVHRDIKPENILLHDGQAIVADFGIALAVSSAAGGRLTQTGLSLGTPQYMSPEQAIGERQVDARSDVYSLAAVTYELLTGSSPFTGATAQAIVAKVITSDPAPLVEQRRSVPANVEAAVLKGLEKNPADRFSSAAEFARALGDASFSTVITGASPRVRGGRGVPWRPIALTAAGLLVVAGALLAREWLRAEPAPVGRYILGDEFGVLGAPAVSPDGSLFAYSNAQSDLIVRKRASLEPQRIAEAPDAWTPFFSPDGRSIGYVSGSPGDLSVVPVAGGAPRVLVRDSAAAHGGSWSDDGWIYYIGHSDAGSTLMRVREDGTRIERIAVVDPAQDELYFNWPEVLPGGRHVLAAMLRRRGPPDIVQVDVRTGQRRPLTRGVRPLYARSGHLLAVQGNGDVTALRMNAKSGAVSGDPVVVLSDLRMIAMRRPIALSREGTLLYIRSQPSAQLVRVSRDGNVEVVDPSMTGRFSLNALSPDGKRMALTIEGGDRTDVWIKELDNGPLTRLTNEGTINYRPAWSPDGRYVLFISDRGGTRQLYQVPADGSAPATLLASHATAVEEAFWSNDGNWLVMRGGSAGNRGIWIRAASADSAMRPLVDGEAQEFSPSLSPDGRYIAYVSDESGSFEVYVRPFPNVSAGRWQVSRNGGAEPLWSADARYLYYRSSANELIAAEVARGSGFAVASQRALFPTRGYVHSINAHGFSVSPDGGYFYFIREMPGTRNQLVVVHNFFAELRAKVRGAAE